MAQLSSQAVLLTSQPSSLFRVSSTPVYSSSSAGKSLGIYVTFRVIRLLNELRKQVNARRSTPRKEVSDRDADFCHDFDRQAFERVDAYLGRKRIYPRTKGFKAPLPVSAATCTPGAEHSELSKPELKSLIDQFGNFGDQDLIEIASNERDFVGHQPQLSVKQLSVEQLAGTVVLLRVILRRIFASGSGSCGAILDPTFLANLEHLLLRFQGEVLILLIARCIEHIQSHLVDCQRERGLALNEPCFEYPNAKRPLSTTWPWSIKPSLAVLWGVCWMFYDRNENKTSSAAAPFFDTFGNMVDVEGNILAPRHAVRSYVSGMQRQQQQAALRGEGGWEKMANTPAADELRRSAGLGPAAQPQLQLQVQFQAAHPHSQRQQHQHQHHSPSASASPAGDSLSACRPPRDLSLVTPSPYGQSLPQVSDFDAWYSLPQRTQNPLTPTLRVTSAWPPHAQDFTQPPADATAFPASAISPQHEYAYSPHFYNTANHYSPRHLSPRAPSGMSQDPSSMQTPVSPVSAHEMNMTDPDPQMSRKRSHSEMSQQPSTAHPNPIPSRSESVASPAGASQTDFHDDFSPRGSRAFKRGDPPTNSVGKFICDFAAECGGQIFERKCEWSKHMDKHDRPYRCPHPSCAKLQGFTYSGGLLRHEREVHGKHGGPKAQLMCPHADCKRHQGKGFTRRENLNEHLRRVHPPNKEHDPLNPSLRRETLDLAVGGSVDGETPASRISEPADHEDSALHSPAKRKLEEEPQTAEEMQRELKKLRALVAYQDDVIRQWEASASQNSQANSQLHEAVQSQHAQLHDPQLR